MVKLELECENDNFLLKKWKFIRKWEMYCLLGRFVNFKFRIKKLKLIM